MKIQKVIVLWNNLGPYHFARLNAFANFADFAVSGIELSSSEALREWATPDIAIEFSRYSLHNGAYEVTGKKYLANRVLQVLGELDPEVIVIAGYSSEPMRTAAQWVKQNGRLSVLMTASQWCDKPRNPIKEWLKGRWIGSHFDAAFVAGVKSSSYLARLGFPPDRIWWGYDVVDNDHFEQVAQVVRTQAMRWRGKLQLPSRYFLYIGRFAPEKNLELLLQAYAFYRSRSVDSPWDLVMVGSGPLERTLKEIAKSRRIEGLHWPGFKQNNELPAYYGLASCFVLPSISEPWGLVVNEAMATGLPVLVSDRCGAAGNLVFPGINGYIFDPYDIGGFARLMGRMSSGEIDLKRMGDASKRIIANYTPETWALALTDCIRQTAERKGISLS